MTPPAFIFTTCQIGAEDALKGEIAREWPQLRFAYSQPGFITFKVAPELALAEDFNLRSVFARAYGLSQGEVPGDTPEEKLEAIAKRLAEERFDRVHLFPRDAQRPGHYRYEPGFTPEVLQWEAELGERIEETLGQSGGWERAGHGEPAADSTQPVEGGRSGAKPPADSTSVVGGMARRRQRVLDVIVITPQKWWFGLHRHARWHLPWPGGLDRRELPEHAVSRAYLKMQQALEWSQLPVEPGQVCAELGCSPGGSSQALLDRGLQVIGIDPAEMPAVLTEHERFTHLRMRTRQVPRKVFGEVDWVTADMNVAPQYTLDAVEDLVRHRETHIRGLLLTLKLLEWKVAADIPKLLERVRGWGFDGVHARQLQYNRQEFTLAAWRKRKPAGRPKKGRGQRRPRKRT